MKTKQQSIKYLFLILLIAVLVIPSVALASWWNPFSWGMWNSIFHKSTPTTQAPVACPMIAKLCPDGSSVSPKGPKCEFPACPTPASPTANWKTYKSSTYDYEIKYPSGYNISWNNSPVSPDILGIDIANYIDKNYDVNFQIFARNGFVLDNCLKDLAGKNITKTIATNNNIFYIYNDHEKGLGGRMALSEGAIKSEYHAVHNGYCYIITYTVTPTYSTSLSPSQMKEKVDTLDQILSTFKFTK